MANTTITPGASTLRLTSVSIIAPLTGALILAGVGSPLGITNPLPTAAMAVSGAAPWMDLGVTVNAGTFALTAAAPLLGFGSAPVMGAGALTLAADSALLAIGTVVPGAGALSMVGAAPSVSIPNATIIPTTGRLQLSADPPIVGAGSITTGALILSGRAPALSFTLRLSPAGTGVALFAGAAPTLAQQIGVPAGHVNVTNLATPSLFPSAAAVTLSGQAPALGGSQAVTIGAATLTLTGSVPPQYLTVPAPPCAALVAGGQLPFVKAAYTIVRGSATLTMSSAPPTFAGNNQFNALTATMLVGRGIPQLALVLNTPTGALTAASAASSVSSSSTVATSTGLATVGGAAPSLGSGVSLPTVTGSASMAGLAPVVSLQARGLPASVDMSMTAAAPLLGFSMMPAVAGRIDLLGAPPSVNGKVILGVPSGSLSLQGQQLLLSVSIAPPAGAAVAVGSVPQFAYSLQPTTGIVTFNGQPASVRVFTVAPNGVLAFGSQPPGLLRTFTLSMGTAEVDLTGAMAQLTPIVTQTITPSAGELDIVGFPAFLPLYTGSGYYTVVSPGSSTYNVTGIGG
jgi:hypothetical protein